MLRDMPIYGYVFGICLIAISILLPYFQVKLVFECYNGVFFKSSGRNRKLISREWGLGKRILLFHFWDKRVHPRYRVWFVGYLIYIAQIIVMLVFQSMDLSLVVPAAIRGVWEEINSQLFAIQLIGILLWFIGLLCLAYSVVSVIPRHSQKKSRNNVHEKRSSAGHAIIWVILLLGYIGMLGLAVLNIVEILERL
jgi:hypothetical protein